MPSWSAASRRPGSISIIRNFPSREKRHERHSECTRRLKPDLVEDTMLWIEANHPIKLKIYTLGFEEALRQASLPPPEYAPDSPRYDPEEPTYQPSSPRYPDSPQREDLEGDIEAVS